MHYQFRMLLLVVALSATAHARVYIPSKLTPHVLAVTSSLTLGDAEGVQKNLLSLEDSVVVRAASSSVVQDWSLVCTQLCGAGLGGTPCASICTSYAGTSDALPAANANALLNPNDKLICQDLCRLQLGDVTCSCADFDTVVEPTIDYNGACSTFCDHNRATLVGCSLCNVEMVKFELPDAAATEIAVDVEEEDRDKVENVVVLDDAETATTATITTTPDWNEVCTALCKTGDGGSLCNCDLSPFFY